MWSMSGRPCNPGNDFKGLWQTFLRDMPMPQCGMPSDPEPVEDSKAPAEASDPPAAAPGKPATNATRNR